ncbi:ABC transporter permease subunit [Metabacillus indicus]|uniref:ABC transporter permease subunit n=1 Tax=Metabacillus indicus TaxID=246786 RepID=UPI003CEBAD91
MKWQERNRLKPAVPAVLFTFIMVFAGLWLAAAESLTAPDGAKSLSAYQDLFTNESFRDSLFYSLKITLLSTVISILAGLLIIRSVYPLLKNRYLKLAAWIPMLFPHFVWGYMLFLLLSQNGWISSISVELGLISSTGAFPDLMKDSEGTGIILTYVWKEIPFVLLILLPVYLQLNTGRKDAVYTLGGNEWDAFKLVEWPVLIPSLIEIFILLFSFIFAAYEVPALLGTTYPKMVSVLTYEWFYSGDWSRRPAAFAVMILSTAVILAALAAVYLLLNKQRERITKSSTLESIPHGNGSRSVMAVLLILFTAPVLFVIAKSMTSGWTGLFPETFSGRGYALLMDEPKLAEALFQSITIAVCVIVLNLLLGIPAAQILAHHSFKGKSAAETLLLTPVIVPVLAVAMGLHTVFIKAGLAGSLSGVVLIHLLPTLPYTIKVMRSGFERAGVMTGEQAALLGAGRFKVFYTIYFPQLIPSIRSVIFLATTISLSQYLLTALIGGGNVLTLAGLYFPYFSSADDTVIASFSLLFAILPIGIWLLFEGLLRLVTPYQKR